MPELIPAIDLRQGRVVRLQKGDDARRTVYERDPGDLLRRFADAGVRRVHIVDLDAAFREPPQRLLLAELAAVAEAVGLLLEVGGGFRNAADLEWGLGAGIDRLVLGSVVANDTDGFLALAERFPGRLVPALEVANGQVRIGGWTEAASVGLDALCHRLRGAPCPAVLVTDVEKDGMLGGPNLDLARHVAGVTGMPALLSGGVRDVDDLRRAGRHAELAGVIVGKAFYEGRIDLAEALRLLHGAEL